MLACKFTWIIWYPVLSIKAKSAASFWHPATPITGPLFSVSTPEAMLQETELFPIVIALNYYLSSWTLNNTTCSYQEEIKYYTQL